MAIRQLGVTATPQRMLNALDVSSVLDTSTLVCLSGQWPLASTVVGWQPRRTVADAARVSGPGWFGWQAFDQAESWWGEFDPLLLAGANGRWSLHSVMSSECELDRLAEQIASCLDLATAAAAPEPRFLSVTMTDRDRHLAAVEHAISAIRAGALYQVNICARIHGELEGTPLALFSAGVEQLAPAYAAFVRTPERSVISFSPELFLHRDGLAVRTAPIKGTRRRTGPAVPDPAVTDAALLDPGLVELRRSDKDQAENIMIVDLMRNDLSRVSVTGSVTTPSLLQIVPAPGVWHLVSEVESTLTPGIEDADLLAATFPPGSVTGAPKLAALDLIANLEDERRGIFSGAIGYLGVAEGSALSVAIRTLEFRGRSFSLGVGGGITADSVPMQEWRECLIKAAPLLALGGVELDLAPDAAPEVVELDAGIFDTLLAVDGVPVALPDHLARLDASLGELYGLSPPEDLAVQISEAVAATSGRYRVRSWVAGDGTTTVQAEPQPAPATTASSAGGAPATPDTVGLRTRRGRTGSWRHKWNDRRYLSDAEAATAPDLPLFIEEVDGRLLVLETSRSNVAIVGAEGLLVTPPLTEQVLPGVGRRRLLDAALDRGWRVDVRPIELAEFIAARLALALNSLGISGVHSVDGQDCPMDAELLEVLRSWDAGRIGLGG
jgi:para-aminobenzoate synthetase/4-amino-4-deoxychorismate lyase